MIVVLLIKKSKIYQKPKIEKLAKSKKSNFTKVKVNRALKTDFFTLKARVIFIQLRKAFIKALIFCYFDQKYYILIETNILSYIIDKIFSQITLH